MGGRGSGVSGGGPNPTKLTDGSKLDVRLGKDGKHHIHDQWYIQPNNAKYKDPNKKYRHITYDENGNFRRGEYSADGIHWRAMTTAESERMMIATEAHLAKELHNSLRQSQNALKRGRQTAATFHADRAQFLERAHRSQSARNDVHGLNRAYDVHNDKTGGKMKVYRGPSFEKNSKGQAVSRNKSVLARQSGKIKSEKPSGTHGTPLRSRSTRARARVRAEKRLKAIQEQRAKDAAKQAIDKRVKAALKSERQINKRPRGRPRKDGIPAGKAPNSRTIAKGNSPTQTRGRAVARASERREAQASAARRATSKESKALRTAREAETAARHRNAREANAESRAALEAASKRVKELGG